MAGGGLLAAAGIFAFSQDWRATLRQDHINMQYIAKSIEEVGGGKKIKIKQATVDTNILFLELTENATLTADILADRLCSEYKVKIDVKNEKSFRIVTH